MIFHAESMRGPLCERRHRPRHQIRHGRIFTTAIYRGLLYVDQRNHQCVYRTAWHRPHSCGELDTLLRDRDMDICAINHREKRMGHCEYTWVADRSQVRLASSGLPMPTIYLITVLSKGSVFTEIIDANRDGQIGERLNSGNGHGQATDYRRFRVG